MIQDFIKKVGDFHDAFGVERGNIDVELRYKLFKEEFEEYLEGCEAEKKGLKYFTTKKGEYVNTFIYKVDAIIDMLYIACGTVDLHEWSYFDRGYRNDGYHTEETCLSHIDQSLEGYLFHGKEGWIYDLIDCCLDLAEINSIYDKLPKLFQEVHLSNLSKLDENGKPIINDGILDPSKPIGKILKSKLFFEPRLKEILENGN